MFYETIRGHFEGFQYFNFETGLLEYRFLVQSTKIENESFPYKTAILEVNVKTNRMVSTKWTYTKNGVLPVSTLFF